MARPDPAVRYQAFLLRAQLAREALQAERPGLDVETDYVADRSEDLRNAARLYCGIVGEIGPRRAPNGRFPSPEAMEAALADLTAPRFEGPTLPPLGLWGLSDAAFGWQRVAGPNPTAIQRVVVDQRPGLPLDQLPPLASLPGVRLAEALDQGRLFAVDHSGLPRVAPEGPGPWLLPAAALFYSHPEGGLRPLGVSLDGGPWVRPDDGAAWTRAKLAFQSADLVDQELRRHLAWTHLLLRSVDRISERRLPPGHPIAWLLAPHLDSVTVNVLIGEQILLAEGGMVAQVLAPSLETSAHIWQRALAAWTPEQLDPARDLRERGCEDREALPFYPYRDHGLPIWEALRRTVGASLALEPGGVAATRAWVEALREELGRWRTSSPIPDSPEALTGLVAGLIFLSSAHHSALSYPQAELYLAVSRAPGSLAGDPRAPLSPGELLPDLERFAAQVEAMWLLSCRRFRRLTELPTDPNREADRPFLHERPALNAERGRFNAEMLRLDEALRAGMEAQPLPYDYLLPSRVSVAACI